MKHAIYRFICQGAAALCLGAPVTTLGQTADQLIDQMLVAEQAGLSAIDNYVLKTNALGIATFEYFEKESSITLDNGRTVYVMRNVPLAEIQRRQYGSNELDSASPEQVEEAARVVREQGVTMEETYRSEMQKAGIPAGLGDMLMTAPPDQPWLSGNPRDMMGMYAMMLDNMAEAKREEAAQDPAAEARNMQAAMADVKAASRIVGRETLAGREAIILEADNLNRVENVDGREFTSDRLRLWIDADKKVPLRMQIDGVMREGNESRPMTIRRDDNDYRSVPGCGDMYRPFRSVMSMSGMLSAAEQAELQQAQAQMADLDKQLASMPPAQRDMIMKQMGPQMKMLESMASGQGFEMTSEVSELRCNTGLPDPQEMLQTSLSGMMPGAAIEGGMPPGAAASAPGMTDKPQSALPATSANSAARQQCLEEKIEAAQASQKKKRGFGKMLGAVSRTAGQLGNSTLGRLAGDVSSANASVEDLADAARDLGITESDIADCN